MSDVTVDEVFSNGHWTGLWNRDVKKQPMRRKLLSAETTCPSRLFTEPCEHGIPNSTASVFFCWRPLLVGGPYPGWKQKGQIATCWMHWLVEKYLSLYFFEGVSLPYIYGRIPWQYHSTMAPCCTFFSSYCNFHLFGVWHFFWFYNNNLIWCWHVSSATSCPLDL